jgi:predicted dehydrogenase
LEEFLSCKEIDAVAVLTPSDLHPAQAIVCAKAGQHVVVEKRMALRLEDADEMILACDDAGASSPSLSTKSLQRSGNKGP